jgi:HupE / UreJ protein
MSVLARVRLLLAGAAILLAAAGLPLWAHEIPTDVRIVAFVKPEGARLRVLVRVPLLAMRDIDFPRRGAGFVDLAHAEPALRDAATLWIADNLILFEEQTPLGAPKVVEARVALPSDRSFTSYDAALAHVTGPRLPDDVHLYWEQGMLDALLEYPIRSEQARFSLHPALARLGLRVTTTVRVVFPDGAVRAFELHGDPGIVLLDPRWHEAARQFVSLGFRHILDGIDHLLFLLCLVVPLRKLRPLIVVVTAFTVAHSITLVASAYDLAPGALWFPPLIETLIAASIVFMAIENIVGSTSASRRWAIAFGFGLVHGFGFSFGLAETLQFSGDHLLASLLAFNVGVELGQILVLALMVPALQALFRFVVAERIGTVVLSVFVAHTGWHWLVERWDRLRQFPLPQPDAWLLVLFLRWAAWAMLLFMLFQLAHIVRSRLFPRQPQHADRHHRQIGD